MTKLNKNYCPKKKQQITENFESAPRVREDFIWWTVLSRIGTVASLAGSARDISRPQQQQQNISDQLPFDVNYLYYGFFFVIILIILIIMF